MKNLTKDENYLTEEEYDYLVNNIVLSIRNDRNAIEAFDQDFNYSEMYRRPTGKTLDKLARKAGVYHDLGKLKNFQAIPSYGELVSVWQDLVAFGIYYQLGTLTPEQENLWNRSKNNLSRFYKSQKINEKYSSDSSYVEISKHMHEPYVLTSGHNACSEVSLENHKHSGGYWYCDDPKENTKLTTNKEEKDMTTPVKVTTEIMGYNKDDLTPEQSVDGLERAQKSIDRLEKSAAAETKYVKDQITELQKAVTMLTAFLNK